MSTAGVHTSSEDAAPPSQSAGLSANVNAHDTAVESSVKPVPPARRFFSKFPMAAWAIDVYLYNNCDDVKDSFDRLCDSWVAELDLMAKFGSSQRIKRTAQMLSTKYSTGSDRKRAQQIRDSLLRTAESKKPNIIVNGNNNNVLGDVHHSNVSIADGGHSSSVDNDKKRKRSKANCARRPASATIFLKHFRKAYENMKTESKWKLPSGLYVEDVVYDRYKEYTEEVAAHSWIIDVADEQMKACFHESDWAPIVASVSKLHALNPVLVKYLAAFGKMTVSSLSDYLDKNAPTPQGTELDCEPEMVAARGWIYDVLRRWAKLCASPSLFTEDHREYWYIANIWNTLFDQCMTTLPGAYMSRGESMSVSTSARKNHPASNTPSSSKRRRVGRLYDGVLKIHDDEIGAAEHSRKHADSPSKKWTRDSLKVTKVLHDMLRELGPKVHGSTVVGMVASGWKCQLMRMAYAKGHMCTLSSDQIRKVPAPSKGVTDLLLLCSVLWSYRTLLSKAKMETNDQVALEAALACAAGASEMPKQVLIPHSVETDGDCSDFTLLDLDEEEEEEVNFINEEDATDL